MGKIAKRCKYQWMRWTETRLEALLQMRLVRYANPEYYRAFFDTILQRSTKIIMTCDLSVEATRGKP
jgi:hypothetical protein